MANEALFTQGGSYAADEMRKLIRGVWTSPAPGGVLDGLIVTVSGALTLSVTPGFAKIDDTTSGSYLVYSTATNVVSVSTNSGGGGTRQDVVYALVNDPGSGGTAGEMTVGITTGTSVIPALAIPLATVSVTTGNVLTKTDGARAYAEPRNPAGAGAHATLAARLAAIESSAAASNAAMVTLTGAQTVTNKDLTSPTNLFPTGVILPPGMIVPYGGNAAPSGWLLCAGQTIPRGGANAALFAAIGDKFGVGNGTDTFVLPDLRGRVIAAPDNMGGTAANRLTGLAQAAERGAQTITLDISQMPAHSHPAAVSTESTNHTHDIAPHSHGGSTHGEGNHQHGMAVPAGSFPATGQGSNPAFRANLGGILTEVAGWHGHGIPSEGLTTGNQKVLHTHDVTMGNTGSGAAVPTVQPTIAINHIIKL